MSEQERKEWVKQSKSLYYEVCDPTSLLCLDLEKETLNAVLELFFKTKATKTDLKVMFDLMTMWNKETSIIDFDSYDQFRFKTGSTMKNGNLSRSFGALKSFGFIERNDYFNSQQYHFLIPVEIMKNNL